MPYLGNLQHTLNLVKVISLKELLCNEYNYWTTELHGRYSELSLLLPSFNFLVSVSGIKTVARLAELGHSRSGTNIKEKTFGVRLLTKVRCGVFLVCSRQPILSRTTATETQFPVFPSTLDAPLN